MDEDGDEKDTPYFDTEKPVQHVFNISEYSGEEEGVRFSGVTLNFLVAGGPVCLRLNPSNCVWFGKEASTCPTPVWTPQLGSNGDSREEPSLSQM